MAGASVSASQGFHKQKLRTWTLGSNSLGSRSAPATSGLCDSGLSFLRLEIGVTAGKAYKSLTGAGTLHVSVSAGIHRPWPHSACLQEG